MPLALPLGACAPVTTAQPVQVWEGSARVVISVQRYRLTFTENVQTHEIRGTLDNRTSGDSFLAAGTLLPTPEGDTLSAQISAGESPRLRASLLGFGVQDVPLKAGALLSGTIRGETLTGNLTINGLRHGLSMKRVRR
ncbi:hypothetical protein CVO96_16395 [Deinococcus koreensis]|uniref:Lipoprotein n=1 Tax=Deinococcus koreensis TaxID=2054903 RepID=A0A2K3V2Y0_9DEIO|nr:hypothetical protein CVO96_16395 [Deinococcus koreensis]